MDIETAVTRLYEDSSLTEDLMDEEAVFLLKWAEDRLPALIAQTADQAPDEETGEEAFETVFKAMRNFIKSTNRFIANRQDMDISEQQTMLTRISTAAQNMGYVINPTQANAYAQRHAEQSNLDALSTLLSTVIPKTASAPSPDVQPAETYAEPIETTASAFTAASTDVEQPVETAIETAIETIDSLHDVEQTDADAAPVDHSQDETLDETVVETPVETAESKIAAGLSAFFSRFSAAANPNPAPTDPDPDALNETLDETKGTELDDQED